MIEYWFNKGTFFYNPGLICYNSLANPTKRLYHSCITKTYKYAFVGERTIPKDIQVSKETFYLFCSWVEKI